MGCCLAGHDRVAAERRTRLIGASILDPRGAEAERSGANGPIFTVSGVPGFP
jgi:hypothetical protein